MNKTDRLYSLGFKEVINLLDGQRLGYIRDVEIELESGRVAALVIPGRLRFFGLFGREDDRIIPWDSIEKMGEDIIFVRLQPASRRKIAEKHNFSLF
jgi:YlmC/YmxH family sporulation protein